MDADGGTELQRGSILRAAAEAGQAKETKAIALIQ